MNFCAFVFTMHSFFTLFLQNLDYATNERVIRKISTEKCTATLSESDILNTVQSRPESLYEEL